MAISGDFQVACVRRKRQSTCQMAELHIDTRRFGTIFDADTPENESVDCGDDPNEDDDCTTSESQWEFNATADTGGSEASETQVGGDTDESCASSISAAQQVIHYYRSSRLDREQSHSPQEKGLPLSPHDNHSMVTLNPVEPSSPMDITWRPPLKVHVHPSTKRELDYAQKQAHDMIRKAGLLPEDRIQCRHYGCRNILDNAEALKYHLHFHNIGDIPQHRAQLSGDGCAEGASTVHAHSTHSGQKTGKSSNRTITSGVTSPSKPVVERSDHSHSRHASVPSVSVPRKLSSGGGHRTRPSTSSDPKTVEIFSPRVAPANISSLTAFVNAVDSSRSKSPPLIRPISPTANRGRRSRARARTMSSSSGPKGAGHNASITALISPPSSPGLPTFTRTIMSPRTNVSVHDSGIFIPAGVPVPPQKSEVERAKSPVRAKSPLRARSPIRDGLKRVLSFGCVVD